jgi:hypothetical protein
MEGGRGRGTACLPALPACLLVQAAAHDSALSVQVPALALYTRTYYS